ncbi:Uncharacterized protein dnm_036940 [Desulfonema magnum]|uniref:Uncharacterized protein n=1 Tax=Desulfonema magnum TaxID=45655 RepID=A0A975GND5_9BACT|nr:Uncharacterized protein dnm_036940 [Desulfonema magnum]
MLILKSKYKLVLFCKNLSFNKKFPYSADANFICILVSTLRVRDECRNQDANCLFCIPTQSVTAIKLRLIRGGKKSFRQGCEK